MGQESNLGEKLCMPISKIAQLFMVVRTNYNH